MKKRFIVLLYVVAILGIAFPVSAAEQYPTKPIRFIVPVAPGGGTDLVGRFIAHQLDEGLGEKVVVENRGGAGGTIGVDLGRGSAPDGYTLTMLSTSYATNPLTYKLKFDPVNDITPIIRIADGPQILVVNPKLPVKTIKDLISYAKSNPGKINAASVGPGSITHLCAELFASMAGVKFNHVQYKGSGPALSDTVAGVTDIHFSNGPPALPQIEGGTVRAIAVSTLKRVTALPNVPTIDESGVPGYNVTHWFGLMGPKGMPRPIVDRINREVNKVLQKKETVEKLQKECMSPTGGTPEEFKAMLDRVIRGWKKVAADNDLKFE
jgi:tripartite-type tricarboxylate transporter receptor subunit TctC